MLDLCTGSGALAVLAAMRFPDAAVDAVDISADALEVAARNVREHGLGERITLLRGDLFAPVKRTSATISSSAIRPMSMPRAWRRCRRNAGTSRRSRSTAAATASTSSPASSHKAGRHLTEDGGLLCEVGRDRPVLEARYPALPFLWLDTEESSGEVFWLGADALR